MIEFLFFSFTKDEACKFLNEKLPDDENIDAVLEDFRAKDDEIYDGALEKLHKRRNEGDKENDVAASTSAQPTNARNTKAAAKKPTTANASGRGGKRTAAAKNDVKASTNSVSFQLQSLIPFFSSFFHMFYHVEHPKNGNKATKYSTIFNISSTNASN